MLNDYTNSAYFGKIKANQLSLMPIHLERLFAELNHKKELYTVKVPGIWVNFKSSKAVQVDYADFLGRRIREMIDAGQQDMAPNDHWTRSALVYNVFVRFFSAYDHDHDGKLGENASDTTLNDQGIRETGTLLKTIALLPYLSSLGVNTLHLLPLTLIGEEGRKGDLGSPYAIKNPFVIDPTIADPMVSMSVDEQYIALVEAAHLMGMGVVQEFIFRTAAIDADWTQEHPEWFYWIKDRKGYGPPAFSTKQLEQIMKVPEGKGRYVPPDQDYRQQFIIPSPETDYSKLKTASAFADWPPNDLQPPWSDVTYLRLFDYDYSRENNYNYIAYNTIRYYDPELAQKDNINTSLWDKILDIIPYYQQKFGIDGAMIDMGHALPDQLKNRLIKKARQYDPYFAFWDENFSNKEETKKEGYDAVIGDMWYKITKRNGYKKIISSLNDHPPLPYFGAAETHNSPRFGTENKRKKKAAWILFNLLPHAIPFIHNGFELCEKMPVNTGLNFTKAQIDDWSSKRLPLFYKSAMNWDTDDNIVELMQRTAQLRKANPWILIRTIFRCSLLTIAGCWDF